MNQLFRFLSVMVWVGLCCRVDASEVRLLHTLIAPRDALRAGDSAEVQVAVLNASSVAANVSSPVTLAGHIAQSGWRAEAPLRARDAEASSSLIAAGGFRLQAYTLAIPGDAPSGIVTLEVQTEAGAVTRAALEITPGSPSDRQSALDKKHRPPTNLVPAPPAAAALQRMFADRLSPYESTYFLYGADAPAAKFQLSFKYKLLDFRGVASQRMARSLHLAFTQRSLWDIAAKSSPFYDTSYMPELMYESLAPQPAKRDGFTWLGVQGAVKHESNGRDGLLSRSLNTLYLRTAFAFGPVGGWRLIVLPELWEYISSLGDNPDIADYRGHGKIRLVVGRNDGPSLTAALWAGKRFNHPTAQFDFTLPVRTQLLEFQTYLLIQYYNGYGESLVSYRDHTETIRAGFSLVR